MSLQSIIIPKKVERVTIELYINKNWDSKKVPDPIEYFNTLKAFSNVIAGKTGIQIPIDHISINVGVSDDFPHGQPVVVVTGSRPVDEADRLRESMKEYMKLIVPSLGCNHADFYITQHQQYNY